MATTAVCWYAGIVACNSDYGFTVTFADLAVPPNVALMATTVFAATGLVCTLNVTLFAPDYIPQRSWRANLQWNAPVLNNGGKRTFST